MTYRRRPSSQPYPLGLIVLTGVLGLPVLLVVFAIPVVVAGYCSGGWVAVVAMLG